MRVYGWLLLFGFVQVAAGQAPPAPGAAGAPRPANATGGGVPPRPAAPEAGPCPLPILPALPAREERTFYATANVPHGQLLPVQYKNYAGAEKRMHVYLPPGYTEQGSTRYPVLYLNHGGGDDDSKWSNTEERTGGAAHLILDNLIASGKAKPMLVVMPNTRSCVSATPPAAGETDPCTKEFLQDIIPYVDSHYRTQANRAGRALAGLSMGGFVVLHTGLTQLDTFSELYVYSSGHIGNAGYHQFADRFKSLMQDPATNNRFRVPIYFAAGETDIALHNGQRVLGFLNQHGIRNFWVLSSGGHDWNNWRRYLYQTAQIMFPNCPTP